MKRRSFIAGGTAAAALATSGFLGPQRRTPMTFTDTVPSGALDELLASMLPGQWVNMHNATTQPLGLYDVRPPDDVDLWGINHDGNDWRGDWDLIEGGLGEGITWISQSRVIQSWNGGSLVTKPGHTRFYICGAGGHNDYGGNEGYSFDLEAAAASKNTGGNGGVWVRLSDPARIGHCRDGNGDPYRPFNTNYPYTTHISSNTLIRREVYDNVDPFGTDQRHVGPTSNHVYGAHEYDPDLDGILVYGTSRWRNSQPEVGFWMWSIANQRWELLPPDYALGAGMAATTGDIQVDQIDGSSPFEYIIRRYDTDKYFFGRRGLSFRIRLDGTDWARNPGGVNTNAQTTGSWSGSPYSRQQWCVLAPFDRTSPPGGTGSPLAAWFCSDDGGSTIWPDIDQGEDENNSTTLAYAEAAPTGVDFSSGVYDAANDRFMFLHETWNAGFNGQIYSLDRTTQQWTTLVNPGVGNGPPQAGSSSSNGTYGRYAYDATRNYHLICYDSDQTQVVGKVWICKGV